MTLPIQPVNPDNRLAGPNAGGVLDKDDFLQLLVTQLRHQDPLNPLDGTQFATQLAQFSSLEQLIQLNDGMAAQSAQQAMTQLSLSTNLAASLIGRSVLGFGDAIAVTGSGEHSVVVDLAAGGVGTIDIIDEFGNTVATKSLGGVNGGPQQRLSFELDGTVPPGTYRYRVNVSDSAGNRVGVEQYTSGVVAGVFFDGQGVTLRLEGGLRMGLNELSEIEPAGMNGKS